MVDTYVVMGCLSFAQNSSCKVEAGVHRLEEGIHDVLVPAGSQPLPCFKVGILLAPHAVPPSLFLALVRALAEHTGDGHVTCSRAQGAIESQCLAKTRQRLPRFDCEAAAALGMLAARGRSPRANSTAQGVPAGGRCTAVELVGRLCNSHQKIWHAL